MLLAVCERENLKKALRRVKANKGSPGVDGMTVEQLPDYLRAHWPQHRDELLRGTYRPSPVRRVEIPKPDGGVRKLGIPTVLDRFIQQAVLQVLQRDFDPTFSNHSYGFRPGRSAHQAVAAAQGTCRDAVHGLKSDFRRWIIPGTTCSWHVVRRHVEVVGELHDVRHGGGPSRFLCGDAPHSQRRDDESLPPLRHFWDRVVLLRAPVNK